MTKTLNEFLERLHELFYLDTEGNLIRRVSVNSRARKGEVISPSEDYYRTVGVDGSYYLMHRLVHYLNSGEWPDTVDHIDGDTSNCHPDNLRSATQQEQCRNRRTKSSTGYKGVHPSKSRYRARIWDGEKRIGLGSYLTKEAAAEAYNLKALELFGEFASLNVIKEHNEHYN